MGGESMGRGDKAEELTGVAARKEEMDV